MMYLVHALDRLLSAVARRQRHAVGDRAGAVRASILWRFATRAALEEPLDLAYRVWCRQLTFLHVVERVGGNPARLAIVALPPCHWWSWCCWCRALAVFQHCCQRWRHLFFEGTWCQYLVSDYQWSLNWYKLLGRPCWWCCLPFRHFIFDDDGD